MLKSRFNPQVSSGPLFYLGCDNTRLMPPIDLSNNLCHQPPIDIKPDGASVPDLEPVGLSPGPLNLQAFQSAFQIDQSSAMDP